MSNPDKPLFYNAFGLRRGDLLSLVGAGGKTTLMFRLAAEAKGLGLRVLVTTSTRILVPAANQCDALDLSGKLFADQTVTEPGIYVGGLPDSSSSLKMVGVRQDLLAWQRKRFDLVLVEADGSAARPLKGWRHDEPVVTDCTTATLGVLDIQTLGHKVDNALVHRPEIFSYLTGAEQGDTIALGHLLRLVIHNEGLFAKALGREMLFISKVETEEHRRNSDTLRSQLENLHIVAGSVVEGSIHG